MLVGSPAVAARAAFAGGRVDPRVAGEDHLGPGPAVAVGGLLVLAEAHLREGPVDAGQFVVAQQKPGEDDGQLASAAVPAPAGPAGMARADHAAQVDADLDVVHQQRLLLLGLQVGAEEQGGDAGDPAVLQPVLRHVLHRLLEAEEAGPHPGPLREADVLLDLGACSCVAAAVGSSSRLRLRAR